MRRKLTLSLIPWLLVAISGCTSMIHSVTDEPVKRDPTETSIGTDINDWQIETYVGVNIKKAHAQLESAHVNVYSLNGVVLLTGEVATNELRSLAGETARDFLGVRQVHNELQVQPPTSLLSRTNDTWLTTKVRTKFIAEKNFDGSDIKIVTENNVVYLMGLVSRAQGKQAALVASTTRGVKRVVKVFEYID